MATENQLIRTKAGVVKQQWSKDHYSPADKQRVQSSLAALQQTFKPDQPMPIETQKIYFAALADMGVQRIEQACLLAIQKLRWFPKPAELRELIAEPDDDPGLRAAIAWRLVMRHCTAYNVRSKRAIDFADPLINAAVRAIGGVDAVAIHGTDSEHERYTRPQFIKAYVRFADCHNLTSRSCGPLTSKFTNSELAPIRIACSRSVHRPAIAPHDPAIENLIANVAANLTELPTFNG